jgi:hypothetical protein
MGDYERSTDVQVPPARLFSYLADVANLPGYLPRLTSATPTHDDKVDVTAHIDPPDGPPRDIRARGASVHSPIAAMPAPGSVLSKSPHPAVPAARAPVWRASLLPGTGKPV